MFELAPSLLSADFTRLAEEIRAVEAGGARGSFTVSQCFAGRKNRMFYELSGSKCSVVWDQERPNEMWIGYREKANELLMKDPSLLSPRARAYAHYPGGHPEAYPDGLKNFLLQ